MSKASSVSWEHTQLVRREGERLDSTLKGMNSLEDGCSIETGFMEVPWKEGWERTMVRSYQYWEYVIMVC